jgi:hypothetical protein
MESTICSRSQFKGVLDREKPARLKAVLPGRMTIERGSAILRISDVLELRYLG